jgi:16S rRNA (cytidine1402-2'-O)-methyltransferase
VPALASSGIPCNTFHFEGFLPHKKGRHTALTRLANLEETFVIYESTHRLQKCIDELIEYCGGERLACVCRELSKMYEECYTDTLHNLKIYYASHSTKGEIVIVVSGKSQHS